MASAFSSSETEVLDRQVDSKSAENWTINNVWSEVQKSVCCEWVNKNEFLKVCLQFPDDQLPCSTKVLDELSVGCPGVQFFILADTSYGSCCVDEIAAAHAQAESVIHFGNACQSRVTRLPVFYIFPRLDFSPDNFVDCVSKVKFAGTQGVTQNIRIFFEPGYYHVVDDDATKISMLEKLETLGIGLTNVTLLKYPAQISNIAANEIQDVCIFIGTDDQTFFNLSMSAKGRQWFLYDPKENKLSETDPRTTQWIRRRHFQIEKCKEARTLGLIVATLTAASYLDVINRIQGMAYARDKRTYLISVGKINPAKLGNFMEVDCFILIGCPFNNIYTSREFYRPVVSVFEAELALNPAWRDEFPETYSLNFKDVLPEGNQYREFNPNEIEESDVSLVSGNLVKGKSETACEQSANVQNRGALAERKNYQLAESSGGATFEDRSWRGLEQNLGRTEPAKVTKGLSGIPTNYTHD